MGARTVRLIAGLMAALAWPASAVAFTPPELFVRPQLGGIEHMPAGDWVPLASTPDINYIGGFQIGYRLQSSGEPNELQRAALSFLAVPDGQPTQPTNTPPYCVTQIGTPGTIVPVGSEVQYEGNGTYTVQVSIGAGSGGATDCLVGTVDHGVVHRLRPGHAEARRRPARLPPRGPRGESVRRRARRPAAGRLRRDGLRA